MVTLGESITVKQKTGIQRVLKMDSSDLVVLDGLRMK